jgi:protein SCO1/2
MLRRVLLLLAVLGLGGCQHDLTSPQDVSISGLVPPLAFTMQDAQTGKTVTAASFKGSVVLLYFGYTHCPDACPATLYNLQRVLQRMGPPAVKVKILFVTVDPERDTPDELAQYAALFGPSVTGLRGNADELYSLARRYRVVFSVTKTPVYSVTHSSAVYVFNANGSPAFIISGIEAPKPDLDGIAQDLQDVIGD